MCIIGTLCFSACSSLKLLKMILIKFDIDLYIKGWYMDFLLLCISQVTYSIKSEKFMSSGVSPVCWLINYQSTWHQNRCENLIPCMVSRLAHASTLNKFQVQWSMNNCKEFIWETCMSVQYTMAVYLCSILQKRFQNNFPGHHSGNDGKAAL